MLKSFLTLGGRYTPEHPDYRRTVLVHITLGVLAVVCVAFFVLNLWVFDLPQLAVIDAVALALTILLLALRRRGIASLDAIAMATVVLMAVFLISFLWLVGNRFFGLVWLTVYPGLALFLLGSRRGLMACFGAFGGAALALGGHAHEWGQEAFGPASLANLSAALICLVLQAHFHERSRQEVLSVLREKNLELQKLSQTDRLTGLHNRMSVETALERELGRRARGGQAFSVLLLDLDHFKRVNDLFGHAVGDRVLQTVSAVLMREVRGPDVVGRWGGEEFLVLCAQADRVGARVLGERIRTAIAAESFPVVGRQTVSIGVASHAGTEDAAALVARADAALYLAKMAGRDRVVAAEP